MPVATGTTREENLGWEWLADCCLGPLEPISHGEGRAPTKDYKSEGGGSHHPAQEGFNF